MTHAHWVSDGIAHMRSQGKRLLVRRDVGDRQLNSGLVMVCARGRVEKGADGLARLGAQPKVPRHPPRPTPRMASESG